MYKVYSNSDKAITAPKSLKIGWTVVKQSPLQKGKKKPVDKKEEV